MDSLEEPDLAITNPPWGDIGRTLTFVAVASLSKTALNVCNTTYFKNIGAFYEVVKEREKGRGLLTVCNHTSTLDDPVVLSAMIPLSYFATEHQHHGLRWSLCAKELCFKNYLLGQFFLNGKTLPIERGAGVDQPIMTTAGELLRRGEWLHLFPEGRVGYTGTLGPLKSGAGKLICDSVKEPGAKAPVVLPFYHSGMGAVMPKGARFPRFGKEVTITVGEPIPLDDIICRCNQEGVDQYQVWRDISVRIAGELMALESRSPPNIAQVQRAPIVATSHHTS